MTIGDKTGIIYAATRKGVESLYDYLHSKGYRVGKYHAGLSDTERTRNQEQFLFDEISLREIINLINLLIAEEYLKLTESKFPIVQLRKKVIPVLRNEERVTQRVPRRKQAHRRGCLAFWGTSGLAETNRGAGKGAALYYFSRQHLAGNVPLPAKGCPVHASHPQSRRN